MLVTEFYSKENLDQYQDLRYCGAGEELEYMVGDIESSLDEDNQWKFELIVLSDGYNFYEFFNIEECIQFMFDYEDELIVYFHNLDFDMLFFFKEKMFKDEIENVSLINSGNLTIAFTVRNVTFKNTLTLFPMPLKKLVKSFLHVDDREWLDDKSNVLELERETLLNYCRKDVIYLLNAIRKFEVYFSDKFKIGLGLTVPSMALKTWKKHFNPDKEFITHKRRNDFFKEGYYFGGHTEKFISGQKVFRGVNYYDVNSLYPSEMINAKFINAKLKRTPATIQNLKRLVNSGRLFFAEIVIDVNSESLRFFPMLDEENHVNKYPFGVQTVKVSEVGIEFILRWGSWDNILEVKTVLIGEDESIIKPFESYVDTFYKYRKSDKGNDVIFKLMLNSLYGKFGQKLERDVKVLNSTYEDKEVKSVINADGMFISTYEEVTPFYQSATNRLDVAGKITEQARLTMGNYMNMIREEFGAESVIYTDTDSIITYANLKGSKLDYLLSDDKLGLLSDEIGYTDSFICLGQKMYHFYKSGKKASKGVKNMSLEDFKGIIRGSNKFVNKRFSRFNALVNRGVHGIQNVPFELKNIRERLD